MPKRTIPQPTDAELAILKVLWQQGPSTVRQVNEIINQDRPTGYTTTLKLMQIMSEKGLVDRDLSKRTHVYKAKVAEETTQGRFVKDIIDKVFSGSAEKLVMKALSAKKISPAELAKIKNMLNEMEKK